MCRHEWIGTADGVRCALCGETLSGEEFRELLAGKSVAKPKTAKTKNKKG